MTLNVYRWEYIHRYFPPEVIEEYRKQIIDEWKSGKFKDKEIWERYGMSENAFYDLIKRFSEEEDLKDKPGNPDSPAHKLGQEEKELIIKKAREERNRIKTLQSAFESDMRQGGHSLTSKKLDRLRNPSPKDGLGPAPISSPILSNCTAFSSIFSIEYSAVPVYVWKSLLPARIDRLLTL